MVNNKNTLQVKHMLNASCCGLVSVETPIGVIVNGDFKTLGIISFELHTFEDGKKVLVMHTGPSENPVSKVAAVGSQEIY